MGGDENEEEEAAGKRNNDSVYPCLEKGRNQIHIQVTEQWPSGKVRLKALLRRFRRRDATSELEFSQALMRLQLGQCEDMGSTNIFHHCSTQSITKPSLNG
jgi:hypothetical protein